MDLLARTLRALSVAILVAAVAIYAVMMLSGCTLPWTKRTCPHVSGNVPPVSEQQLRADWEAYFHTALPACDHWEWAVVDDATYARVCPANSVVCTTYSVTPATRYCPVSYAREANAHDRRAAAHEWVHATLFCLGKRDPDHKDPTLWCPAGFVCNYPSP